VAQLVVEARAAAVVKAGRVPIARLLAVVAVRAARAKVFSRAPAAEPADRKAVLPVAAVRRVAVQPEAELPAVVDKPVPAVALKAAEAGRPVRAVASTAVVADRLARTVPCKAAAVRLDLSAVAQVRPAVLVECLMPVALPVVEGPAVEEPAQAVPMAAVLQAAA
jgi:hypothetical protein